MSARIIDLTTDRRAVEARMREQIELRDEELDATHQENRTLRQLRAEQAQRLIEQGGRLTALQRRHRLAIILGAVGWMIAAALLVDLATRLAGWR